MPELDPFDARLETAVHAFADRAQTHVNASEVAHRAIGRRRTGVLAVLGHSVPVPVPVLVVLVLLLLALALSLSIGAPWNRQGYLPAIAVASPSPGVTAERTPRVVTPSPFPPPDGEGDEAVAGTEVVALQLPDLEGGDGRVTWVRDAVITTRASMNDPRVAGDGTWQISADLRAGQGPAWGTYGLVNPGGTWEGTCTGSLWAAGAGGARSCWLAGSGDYDGYTYFLTVTWSDMDGDVRGVIYPGSPPAL